MSSPLCERLKLLLLLWLLQLLRRQEGLLLWLLWLRLLWLRQQEGLLFVLLLRQAERLRLLLLLQGCGGLRAWGLWW